MDSAKTIEALFHEVNVLMFGEHGGQQCVLMALLSLMYNCKGLICGENDLIGIMVVGNELYTFLCCLAGQSFVRLKELPTLISVFDTYFQFQYRKSYSALIGSDAVIDGNEYCMLLHTAFQSLIAGDYNHLLL